MKYLRLSVAGRCKQINNVEIYCLLIPTPCLKCVEEYEEYLLYHVVRKLKIASGSCLIWQICRSNCIGMDLTKNLEYSAFINDYVAPTQFVLKRLPAITRALFFTYLYKKGLPASRKRL